MKHRRVVALIAGVLLTACGAPEVARHASSSTATAPIPAVTTATMPAAPPTLVPANPVVESDPQSDHPTADESPAPEGDWKTVTWQGLQIPVPSEDAWEAAITANERVNGLQVVAAGRIMDNPSGDAHDDQHTDHPTDDHGHPEDHGSAFDGPVYIILQTTDSLDAWLDAERKNEVSMAGNKVENATIRDITIAGRPAKAYQRAIIGLALTEYYVVKISHDRLLWITTYNAEDAKYRLSIDQLVIQSQ